MLYVVLVSHNRQAKRRLLQMPLAAIKIPAPREGGVVVYLVDKKANFTMTRSILKQAHSYVTQGGKVIFPRETVKELLQLAESDAERQRVTYAIVQSSGLSTTKLRDIYGFEDVNSRKQKVETALREAREIRESVERLSHIKEQAFFVHMALSF